MTEELQEFLSAKLESISKSDLTMGVVCPTLAAAIKDTFEIKATHTGVVPEVIVIIFIQIILCRYFYINKSKLFTQELFQRLVLLTYVL